MSRLDNYIFLSICERSLELFKNSYFSTYIGFCQTLKSAMEIGELGRGDLYIIYEIDDYLGQIYCLSPEESTKYIADFFLLEKYLKLEYTVRLTFEFFKNSFN